MERFLFSLRIFSFSHKVIGLVWVIFGFFCGWGFFVLFVALFCVLLHFVIDGLRRLVSVSVLAWSSRWWSWWWWWGEGAGEEKR